MARSRMQPSWRRAFSVECESAIDEMDFQRACQLYLWALPIVGFEQCRATMEGTAGALRGDVGVFEGYRNVSVFFTPNVTTPFSLGALDIAKTVAELRFSRLAGFAAWVI